MEIKEKFEEQAESLKEEFNQKIGNIISNGTKRLGIKTKRPDKEIVQELFESFIIRKLNIDENVFNIEKLKNDFIQDTLNDYTTNKLLSLISIYVKLKHKKFIELTPEEKLKVLEDNMRDLNEGESPALFEMKTIFNFDNITVVPYPLSCTTDDVMFLQNKKVNGHKELVDWLVSESSKYKELYIHSIFKLDKDENNVYYVRYAVKK